MAPLLPSPRRIPSAAGHAHETQHLDLLLGVEVMPLRLQVQRRHQCRAQALAVAGMAAQQFAQVERPSWPRQSTSLPSAVTRTRLQSPQKLLL